MLSLALAVSMALAAGSAAIRPTQALAADGAEAATTSGHAGRGRGAFDDEWDVECVSITGSHERHTCLTLDESAVTPIKDGWWLLEDGSVPKNQIIEVAGHVSFVCSGAVDLAFGRIHVAKGATLTLYCEAGTEDTATLKGMNNRGVIESEGTVIKGGFPIGGEGVHDVIMCAGKDDEAHPVNVAGALDLATQGSTLASGTYVLSSDKTYNGRLRLAGDVTIILREGVTLNCQQGIHVPSGKSFTVDSEVGETSTLIADATRDDAAAGIGGDCVGDGGGTVNIYGAHVFAKGGLCAAGIGAANCVTGDGGYTAGDVTICNAYVEATGNDSAAGIGGCREVNGGKVVIKRSTVKAWGGEAGAAGIGGGHMASAGPVEIIGSTVEATGGRHSAGIGGGGSGLLTAEAGNGGTVKIVDSKVTATGKGRAAGIGGGGDEEGTAFVGAGNGGDVTISGNSVVDATAGSGAAIGRGEGADGVGSVSMDAGLRVVDLDNGGVIAPFDLRGEFCKYRNHVRVEPGESRK